MDKLTDPRPPLPEWITEAYDVLYAHNLDEDNSSKSQPIPRDEALDILADDDELALEPEDANYALMRLLDRGYFYEVDDELHVTTAED